MSSHHFSIVDAGAGLGPLVLAGALLLISAGCADILEVSRPDIILPGDLTGPQGRAVLYIGALGDFADAYSGGGGTFDASMTTTTGLLADEWIHSGPAPVRTEIDRRAIAETNGQVLDLFESISRARRAAEDAATILSGAATDSGAPRVGELWALAGYSYVFLAEAFCNGVPASGVDGGTIVHGEPLTNVELYDTALARFDASLAANGDDPDLDNLARVGKARALVNLGSVAEAAALVADVPTGWTYVVRHSASTLGSQNTVHALNTAGQRLSLANAEGGSGVAFRDLGDPRVPWSLDGVGFGTQTPHYDLLKYPAAGSPVTLAGGAEARYIEAEAALRTDAIGEFFSHIDAVRGQHGLGPAADPGTATGRQDLLFRERALTLFATGSRLGDLRRLIRQYGRDDDDVFPKGPYFDSASYGNDVNLPVPSQERTNPNFTGCLDRSA